MTPATASTDADREACLQAAGALDADLGWALGVVFRSYLQNANAAVTNIPGGPRGYQVLATASRGVCSSQMALAQQLGVDRTVMTYLLDDLERAGLVERQPDPADRRARRIVATDQGRELLAELDQRLRQVEERVLTALDDKDRATFRALLQRLATHADAHDPVAGACDVVDELSRAGGSAADRSRRPARRR